MATKDDPTLKRVFDKFVPILGNMEMLQFELSKANLSDLKFFLDNFDEWEEHITARRMFVMELGRRRAASVTGVTPNTNLSMGAVQAEPDLSATTALSPSGIPIGGTANLQAGPAQMRAEGVVGGRVAADEAVTRGSGLIADLDYRISLSDPRVKKQHTESKAELEALLKKLDEFHGQDAGLGPGTNTEELPLSQEDLEMLKGAVKAAVDLHDTPSLSPHLIDALKSIYEFLGECLSKLAALGISAAGAFQALEWAVEALKAFLDALGAL